MPLSNGRQQDAANDLFQISARGQPEEKRGVKFGLDKIAFVV